MMAMPVEQKMSAREFLALPPREGAAWRELVDGEVIVNEPNARHNLVQTRLILALGDWIRAGEGRGWMYIPLDVKLDDHNVFCPDVSWYPEAHAPGWDDPPPYGRPDLAIEIRSPSTWRYDVGVKKSVYEERGLPELWLVDTAAEQVLVFRRSATKVERFEVSLELNRGKVLESPLLPDFALPLDQLFELD